jgi:hypothetical protein
MTRVYSRSEILSFYDLNADQKNSVIDYTDLESAENDSYVLLDGEVLPLSMFIRTDSGLWHGIYGTSYFSAYFIRLSKCGSMAVVADRYF